ncbi:MAG: hypothetical protein JXM68_07745 [Sedimentisphaerales bacterium]|nr:hypothetical protein [Sedimentisphaerales bacterium]
MPNNDGFRFLTYRKGDCMHKFEALDYCHDSTVNKIIVETLNDERKISIIATFHSDTCCADYDDKTFIISLGGILLSKHIIYGYCLGDELIDGVDYLVSNDMLEEIKNYKHKPKQYITITFISGSKMEVACDSIDVSII